LHTRTQQTLALIVTAWCAAWATSGMCGRALKNGQKLKHVTNFGRFIIFFHTRFLTKWCIASKTLKPWLLILFNGASLKAMTWVNRGKTTRWLDYGNSLLGILCSLTFVSSLHACDVVSSKLCRPTLEVNTEVDEDQSTTGKHLLDLAPYILQNGVTNRFKYLSIILILTTKLTNLFILYSLCLSKCCGKHEGAAEFLLLFLHY
jgi:hypothetical protein